MLQNLNFHSDGDFYVSDTMTGGEKAVIGFQAKFASAGASVITEFAIDPEMGWETASSHKASENYADVISGALEGINVRIRTDRNPVAAKYEQL